MLKVTNYFLCKYRATVTFERCIICKQLHFSSFFDLHALLHKAMKNQTSVRFFFCQFCSFIFVFQILQNQTFETWCESQNEIWRHSISVNSEKILNADWLTFTINLLWCKKLQLYVKKGGKVGLILGNRILDKNKIFMENLGI